MPSEAALQARSTSTQCQPVLQTTTPLWSMLKPRAGALARKGCSCRCDACKEKLHNTKIQRTEA